MKKVGCRGERKKIRYLVNFGPKKDRDGLPETTGNTVKIKGLSFRCPVMIVPIFLRLDTKK